ARSSPGPRRRRAPSRPSRRRRASSSSRSRRRTRPRRHPRRGAAGPRPSRRRPEAPVTRRSPSVLRYAGGIAALAAVAVLWLAFAPTRLGGSVDYAVIYGTSMEPGLHRGDLVVLHTRGSYSVGEAVGYHNRELGRVVLHRIVGRLGDRYVFKGDNNSFLDTYHPTGSELIGRMWV